MYFVEWNLKKRRLDENLKTIWVVHLGKTCVRGMCIGPVHLLKYCLPGTFMLLMLWCLLRHENSLFSLYLVFTHLLLHLFICKDLSTIEVTLQIPNKYGYYWVLTNSSLAWRRSGFKSRGRLTQVVK